MNKIHLAYVAGLIDGEGYIGIKKNMTSVRNGHSKSPLYHERIQIRMVEESAIQFIAETLGGNYYKENMLHHKFGRRQLYCYQASDAGAARILRLVLPYLIIKYKQAETILKLTEFKKNYRHGRRDIVCLRCGKHRKMYAKGLCGKCYDVLRRQGKLSHYPPSDQTMPKEKIEQREKLYLECKRLNHPT